MSPALPKKGRILIGEDTADIAYLMKVALQAAGYSVETTTDGVECLRGRGRVGPISWCSIS